MLNFTKKNFKLLQLLLLVLVIMLILLFFMYNHKKDSLVIKNKMVKDKYESLVSIIGPSVYIEKDNDNNMKTVTWQHPLSKSAEFGKYGGCDYIRIRGHPSKKYHPHPADVFLIVGKYLNVPEHLFGPLKYASETINIEQLFVPDSYSNKYYNTGEKELALVTGSCASVTISVITIQFVIDMIEKYKGDTDKSLELYEEFRNEYDRRIDDYLCNKGITNPINWFNPEYFNEPNVMNIGDDICNNS